MNVLAFILAFILAMFSQTLIAADMPSPSGPLNIDAQLIPCAANIGGSIILVNVENISAYLRLSNLTSTVETPLGPVSKLEIPILEPEQSQFLKFSLPFKQNTAWIIINFQFNNQSNSVVRAVTFQSKGESGFVTSVLPALLSVISVIIGACLVHRLTLRQELLKNRLEWRKTIFEKNEAAYRDFITGWGGAASGAILTKQFQKLQSRAFIPIGVVEKYNQAMRVLEELNSTEEHKQHAVDKFREYFDNYLLNI